MTASSVENYPKYLRTDPLTGIGNPLAFFEWLLGYTNLRHFPPFTLISLDIMHLKQLNDSHGHLAGDAAVRWAALVLLEEAEASVFRISGDEFVGVLIGDSTKDREKLGKKVFQRLTKEAAQVNLEPPAASLALIHYSGLERISPEDVLGVIYGALINTKQDHDHTFKVFDAATTEPVEPKTGLLNDMVRRMVSLGSMLDESHQLAYSDSISGLPNMHAAMAECESMILKHEANQTAFTILLIDGDDLSRYNKVGYLAGDNMIANLGAVLKDQMRPSDFLARWRSGDEFLILLEDTQDNRAITISNRLLEAVVEASQEWTFPITISIGVAGFPEHGNTIPALLHQAELALGQAKKRGKNQVCVNHDGVANCAMQ